MGVKVVATRQGERPIVFADITILIETCSTINSILPLQQLLT